MLVPLLVVSLAGAAGAADAPSGIRVVELVADPQTDWNGDGKITPSDEFVELFNEGDATIQLDGWVLHLDDTTPEQAGLIGAVGPGQRLVVWNPPGAINNDGVVRLVDGDGFEHDRLAYGSYDESGTVPDANAADLRDEALAFDGSGWVRGHATPGADGDGAFWTVAHKFDEQGGVWFTPANGTGNVSVRLVHGSRVVDNVTLDGVAPESHEGVPGQVVDAAFHVAAGSGTARDLVLRFDLDGVSGSVIVARLVVDADPPAVPEPVAPSWASGDAFTVWWDPSVDDGVGGVGYGVEVEREVNGSRTVERRAAQEPEAQVAPVGDGQVVDVRVRASDAYGNVGPWSVTTRTRVDHEPPTQPGGLSVDGVSETRVTWAAAQDAGAGVDRYEVERWWDGQVDRFDAGLAASWTDPDGPMGGNLSYRVRAVDAAGNVGAWNETTADHPALQPAVVGLRVTKPVWAGGVQEVRIDFDRPMDVARDPDVQGTVAWAEARWFANTSTYYLKAAGPEDAVEGDNVVRVASAWASDGRGLRQAAASVFRVDTVPPTTRFDEAAARFEVEDAQDAAPRLFVKRWPAGEAAPAAYVAWDVGRNASADVEPGRWRLRFFALDDAGNREAVQDAVMVVGAPASEPSPTPTTMAPPPATEAARGLDDPVPVSSPGPPTPPTSTAEAGGLADVEAQRRELAAPQAGAPRWAWWGLGLAGVTASGGVFAWRRDLLGSAVRWWRAWRTPDSLAVRLRRLRGKG